MASDRSNQLLGELLTEAGLLQINDLREATHIARGQNLPIGKVLVMAGYISKELLKASIEIQARLKDNLIDYNLALQVLTLVSKGNYTLEQSLSKLGVKNPRASDSTTHRLGALLLGASLLTETDFKTALAESERCGLPLGRVLTNLAILPEETVDDALGVQKLLRGGQISKKEAIDSLLESKDKMHIVKEEVLGKQNQQSKASFVSDTNSTTIETNKIVQNAKQDINKETTNTVTNKIFPKLESLTLHHMLLMAGLVQTSDVEIAIREGLKKPEVMGLILKQAEILEEFVIEAAQECCQLIGSGQLKPEQAIIALHHCQRTRNSIKDCLEEFGWQQKSQIS